MFQPFVWAQIILLSHSLHGRLKYSRSKWERERERKGETLLFGVFWLFHIDHSGRLMNSSKSLLRGAKQKALKPLGKQGDSL